MLIVVLLNLGHHPEFNEALFWGGGPSPGTERGVREEGGGRTTERDHTGRLLVVIRGVLTHISTFLQVSS